MPWPEGETHQSVGSACIGGCVFLGSFWGGMGGVTCPRQSAQFVSEASHRSCTVVAGGPPDLATCVLLLILLCLLKLAAKQAHLVASSHASLCLDTRACTIKPAGERSSAHSRGKRTAAPMTAGAVMTSPHQISATTANATVHQPERGPFTTWTGRRGFSRHNHTATVMTFSLVFTHIIVPHLLQKKPNGAN